MMGKIKVNKATIARVINPTMMSIRGIDMRLKIIIVN
jgi:hypothetical protein